MHVDFYITHKQFQIELLNLFKELGTFICKVHYFSISTILVGFLISFPFSRCRCSKIKIQHVKYKKYTLYMDYIDNTI